MNLVVGATGTLGTEICRLLRAGAKPVRAADPMQKSFAGLMLSYAHTMPVEMGKLLSACPLKLRSVESYARSVL